MNYFCVNEVMTSILPCQLLNIIIEDLVKKNDRNRAVLVKMACAYKE